MPLGAWDTNGFATTWWDVDGNAAGWWDKDAIPFQEVAPPVPPTPPAPSPRRPRPIIPAGGAAFFPSVPYCPPEWLPQYLLPYTEREEEEIADFALMYVTPPQQSQGVGAIIKALAGGTVEMLIDARGRTSIVLTGDDGTRYLYADVGATAITDGARVRMGQPIARTKPGVPSLPPAITTTGHRPELPAAGVTGASPPPKPAQVVFVDPPPEPAAPPRYWVRLVPIDPPPPPPPIDAQAPPVRGPLSILLRAVAPVAFAAAVLFTVSLFEPKPPKPRSPRKRKRKRRR